jgi:hypothetical protein
MTIKLSVLKSGERLIADIKEAIVDDKPVTYIFENPCLVSIENRQYKISDSDEENVETKIGISLYPWPTFSKDKVIPVPLDWVVTVVEPTDDLKQMYERDVLTHGRKEIEDLSSTEQDDSSDAN